MIFSPTHNGILALVGSIYRMSGRRAALPLDTKDTKSSRRPEIRCRVEMCSLILNRLSDVVVSSNSRYCNEYSILFLSVRHFAPSTHFHTALPRKGLHWPPSLSTYCEFFSFCNDVLTARKLEPELGPRRPRPPIVKHDFGVKNCKASRAVKMAGQASSRGPASLART